MLSIAEKAYLAGLIDGEGSVYISKYVGRIRTQYSSGLIITLTKPRALRYCLRVTQVGSLSKGRLPKNKNHARMWQWKVHSNQAAQILNQVLSFLILKKKQARLQLLFQSRMYDPGRKGLSEIAQRFQRTCYNKMKKLNKRGQ